MKITNALLRKHNACSDQRKLFAKTFPNGAVINKTNITKAIKAGLNLGWVIEVLLPAPAKKDYNASRKPLVDAYYASRKTLDDAYDASCKPMNDAYNASCKPLDDAYYASCKPMNDTYYASCTPMNDAYYASRKPMNDAYYASCKELQIKILLKYARAEK